MAEAVTTQNSVGVARGKFDRVSFALNLEGRDATGPKAKARAQKTLLEQVEPALEKLKKDGITFEKDDQRTTFAVEQNFVYNDELRANQAAGYVARFTVHLETKQVDQVSKIQDVLTSLEGVNVGSPSFSMEPETRRKLQKLALKEAVRIAQERFQEECEILGLKHDDFTFDSWEAQYTDNRAQNRYGNAEVVAACSVMSDASETPSVSIQSSLAAVQVSLQLDFKRKF